MINSEHIFVVDYWVNTKEKEKSLIKLLDFLNQYDIDILLIGHHPINENIQNKVKYFIYDENNEILTYENYHKYNVNSVRWSETDGYKLSTLYEFHHDYAIWSTMRTAFNFCNFLGKKYIHFLEYDNLPNYNQYKQAFIESIEHNDAIIYEYHENSSKQPNLNPYCATFIFSLKTKVAIKLTESINNISEYFSNRDKGWQLERVFLEELRKVTKNIVTSKYIDNDGTLNTQAVWDRDGISRNGAKFQVYLGLDSINDLYIHLISGFYESDANNDYLVEVNYGSHKKFITLHIGEYYLEKIGKYHKNETVKVFHEGVEVYSEILNKEPENFKYFNNLEWKKNEIKPKEINVNFVDGPFIEIIDDVECEYKIEFINNENNQIYYTTTIKNNCWVKCSIKYFVDWRIKVTTKHGFEFIYDLNLNNKRVYIAFESKSLGDSIAWISYVEEFRKKHNCILICSTFHNDLFIDNYENITFITPGITVNNLTAMYKLGLFMDNNNIDYEYHFTDPKQEPLMKIGSDILGLDYTEVKPLLPILGSVKKKMVSIAIHSTAQCKYWNNPNGWQEITDYLLSKGYEVRLLSMEDDGYMGNKNPIGVTKQPKSTLLEIIKTIQESEFFIGVSSGLSWLSWAAGTKTIIISGFTDIHLEPMNDIIRIINKEVCHGCWHKHTFDSSDWNWCPIQKNTDRQFECTKSITSLDVIKRIKESCLI
jgi:autotransporter strand-loop-strand O-heptosyltransferase